MRCSPLIPLTADRRSAVEAAMPLARMIARRMGRHGDPDIVSAAYLGLVTAAASRSYRPDRPFLPWAVPHIRGAILDELRGARHRQLADPTGDHDPRLESPELGEDDDRLHDALRGLAAIDRDAAILIFAYGFTCREAGNALGMSRDGARRAAKRGIAALRSSLGDGAVPASRPGADR